MNNEWNINFLQNSLYAIQHNYSSEFSMVKASLKLLCEAVPYFLKSSASSNLTFELNSQKNEFKEKVTLILILLVFSSLHFHNPVFHKKNLFNKLLHNFFQVGTDLSIQSIHV